MGDISSDHDTHKVSRLKRNKKGISLPLFASSLTIVAMIGFVVGTRADGFSVAGIFQQKQGPSELDLSGVQNAYSVLRSEYDGELDAEKLVEGAKRGLVEATGDPYTTYFTDEEAKSFLNDVEGEFTGIGAELGRKSDQLQIVSTLDDSPAKRAGLQANDLIVKVNGEDSVNWPIEKAVKTIRGEKGTTVKLTVLRDQELKEFAIVRDVITNPSVKSEITEDGIGVMRISTFGQGETYSLARQAADSFRQNNVKGVVLDLRGNGGGYLDTAQQIAGLWMEDEVVVSQRRGDKVIKTLKATGDAPLKGIPTVVLVDGGSASASEIVAGALKDHGVATLVGTKTFGKGSVQTFEPLPGGGQIKVTVARWYTPKGHNISEKGIEPDRKIDVSAEDITAGRDPQKEVALQLIKEKAGN